MNISNIVPVPTLGDFTKADNYCGFSLTSVMAKTYNLMILNRIRPVLSFTQSKWIQTEEINGRPDTGGNYD